MDCTLEDIEQKYIDRTVYQSLRFLLTESDDIEGTSDEDKTLNEGMIISIIVL